MAIKILFEVEVEFKDNGTPSQERDEAIEAALSEAFERDDGVFNLMLPLTGLEGPVPSVPGSVMVEFDELDEAVSAEAGIKEIIKQHGFLVI